MALTAYKVNKTLQSDREPGSVHHIMAPKSWCQNHGVKITTSRRENWWRRAVVKTFTATTGQSPTTECVRGDRCACACAQFVEKVYFLPQWSVRGKNTLSNCT